ncbi:hypothetical protein GJ744_003823 [Endocarpon pusillum]|uniref:Uncharacterized protein n=1 Tax=Endocarpon pusillum TaxID=364733 RepID=A0A8H7E7V3_9EURO|nr:hypothetical protein GJ744_003823 [Endocarpon pusillum]
MNDICNKPGQEPVSLSKKTIHFWSLESDTSAQRAIIESVQSSNMHRRGAFSATAQEVNDLHVILRRQRAATSNNSLRDIGLVKKRINRNKNLSRNGASKTTAALNDATVTSNLQQSSTANNTANLICFEEEKDIIGEEDAEDLRLMFSGPACWFCHSRLKQDLPCYCRRCGFLNSGPAGPGLFPPSPYYMAGTSSEFLVPVRGVVVLLKILFGEGVDDLVGGSLLVLLYEMAS